MERRATNIKLEWPASVAKWGKQVLTNCLAASGPRHEMQKECQRHEKARRQV
jgi:hypothetical protein